MTHPTVPTVKGKGGARFYVDGDSKAIGVTSVLNSLPKPFLQYWGQKLVAEAAVEGFPTLSSFIAQQDKDGAVDWLKRAPQRSTGGAADRGNAVHDVAEALGAGEDPGPIHPDYQSWVDGLKMFLDDWQPDFLMTEETVWCESLAMPYAGTFDAIATIGGETVMLDYKTSKSIYPSVALQLAAYRAADHILWSDGTHHPIPETSGAAAVQIMEGGYKLVPLAQPMDDLMGVFSALMEVYRWDTEVSKGVVGRALKANQ